MKEIKCKVAQKGFCVGPVFLLKEPSRLAFALSENIEEDKKRLKEVITGLQRELKDQAAKAGAENAKILEADAMILEDEAFARAIETELTETGAKLSVAVQEGSWKLAEEFENSKSEYISQRAADVRGLGERLIDLLENRKSAELTVPSVVVAEEMTPGGFAKLDPEKLLGLVTVKGAATSHVSIMAGNLGIPCVYGVESLDALGDVSQMIVDADGAMLLTDPEENALKAAQEKMTRRREERETAAKQAHGAQLKTKVYANISNAENLDVLTASGAEGVGLFRSEFLFLDREQAPDEEEQFKAYSAVLSAMGEKEVIIRTMDIGSDKQANWLKLPEEKNPALGNRGLRVSFLHPELFRTQLRALLRAAVTGNLKVMFPMVASEWEIDRIKEAVKEAADGLAKDSICYKIPSLGIMIETPAAAVIADRLARKVEFFSIGTNDLTQYTIALDREAQGLEEFYQPHHEALLRLIRMVCEAGRKAGIPTGVCGELGSDPEMIPELIDAGVDELSVSVAKVNEVRAQVLKAEKERFFELGSPCDGQMIPMEEIGDPVFASGMLGQAIGVIPSDSVVYAPLAGKLIDLADTKHALTIEGKDGKQVLVHVGIDTVKLNGKGFEALVKKGDELTLGQPLLKVDWDVVKENGYDPTVIVILLEK